jgi:hypothetical protein
MLPLLSFLCVHGGTMRAISHSIMNLMFEHGPKFQLLDNAQIQYS